MDAMIDFAKHSTFCFLMNQIHLSGLRQISMHRLFTQNSFLRSNATVILSDGCVMFARCVDI